MDMEAGNTEANTTHTYILRDCSNIIMGVMIYGYMLAKYGHPTPLEFDQFCPPPSPTT